METVVANTSGAVRHATRNGKRYIVAPMTLIVPGVLAGSQGPLYYPSDEISTNPSQWDNIPIVAYHPFSQDGQHISANSPDVLARQGIGFLEKSHVGSNGRLKGYGWFDVERTKKVDSRILDALDSGKPIELSTGLYTDNHPAPAGANYNGRSYTHIARNYRADHIAVLPDQVGACSLVDGCGVLINKAIDGITEATLKKADFVRLPAPIRKDGGTNCKNCRFEKDEKCTYNDKVDLRGLKVDETTCCSYWDAPDTERPWKNSEKEGTTENQSFDDILAKSMEEEGILVANTREESSFSNRMVDLDHEPADFEEYEGLTTDESGNDDEDEFAVPTEEELSRLSNNDTDISPAEIFATLLHAATSAHILHLSTRSFAAHKALDGLYKSLPGLVDTLVEVWQGRNEIVKQWPSGYEPPTSDPAAFVGSLCDYLKESRGILGTETHIQNLVDEIASELDNTLYRLRFLS